MCTSNWIIGSNLRNERKVAGLSQQQVAEELGIGIRTLYDWENGKSGVKVVTLIKLVELYSKNRPKDLPLISLDDILGFKPGVIKCHGAEIQATARDVAEIELIDYLPIEEEALEEVI